LRPLTRTCITQEFAKKPRSLGIDARLFALPGSRHVQDPYLMGLAPPPHGGRIALPDQIHDQVWFIVLDSNLDRQSSSTRGAATCQDQRAIGVEHIVPCSLRIRS